MGSELIKRGEDLPNHIWSAHINIKNPDLVCQIHKDYISAGSRYITTNTFRTTQRSYSKTGLTKTEATNIADKSLKIAVKAAKDASEGNVKVLGSIAPLEDCYQPELFPGVDIAKEEFRYIGESLKNEGVDIILLETMNSIQETKTCLDAVSHLNLPIWVSFVLKDSKSLLSGENLSNAILALRGYRADVLLLNCNPLDRTQDAINIITENWHREWGVYPNLGIGEPSPDGVINNIHSNKEFLNSINAALRIGATALGGCCGSDMRHIKLIADHSL